MIDNMDMVSKLMHKEMSRRVFGIEITLSGKQRMKMITTMIDQNKKWKTQFYKSLKYENAKIKIF